MAFRALCEGRECEHLKAINLIAFDCFLHQILNRHRRKWCVTVMRRDFSCSRRKYFRFTSNATSLHTEAMILISQWTFYHWALWRNYNRNNMFSFAYPKSVRSTKGTISVILKLSSNKMFYYIKIFSFRNFSSARTLFEFLWAFRALLFIPKMCVISRVFLLVQLRVGIVGWLVWGEPSNESPRETKNYIKDLMPEKA